MRLRQSEHDLLIADDCIKETYFALILRVSLPDCVEPVSCGDGRGQCDWSLAAAGESCVYTVL